MLVTTLRQSTSLLLSERQIYRVICMSRIRMGLTNISLQMAKCLGDRYFLFNHPYKPISVILGIEYINSTNNTILNKCKNIIKVKMHYHSVSDHIKTNGSGI